MEYKIIIDKLSGHDSEGVIGKIYKSKNDLVKSGDILFSIESGKGSIKIKSKYTGKLLALDIDEGDKVKKNQAVGIIEGKIDETTNKAKSKGGYNFGFSQPQKEDISCDVLVIGGGPGGYVAAIRASQLGKKVVVVEKDKIGGTCLNYGCIPTKALVHRSQVLTSIKEASELGFNVSDYKIDFPKVMAGKDQVVDQLVSGIDSLMKNNNIRVIYGNAEVEGKELISVTNKKIAAKISYDKMIIATGASPFKLPIEGKDLAGVLTSKEVLELTEIPQSMVIIGGGIIGMEIAFIYNALGCKVKVVEFLPQILTCLDDDASQLIYDEAIEAGISIYVNSKVAAIKKTMDDQLVTEFELNGKNEFLTSEKILMAVGRKANLASLDLTKLEVELNERANGIKVNEFMQTSNKNIYAIGDITNIIQLAHVASHQGIIAAQHLAGINQAMEYDLIPSAIFTSPEVGTVGINEKTAKAENLDIKVVKCPFMAIGKAIAMNDAKGFVKLIVNKVNNRVIGGTIVGGHGSDLIAIITQLIKDEVTVDDAIEVVYAHPTLAEGIHEALLMADDRGIHFG